MAATVSDGVRAETREGEDFFAAVAATFGAAFGAAVFAGRAGFRAGAFVAFAFVFATMIANQTAGVHRGKKDISPQPHGRERGNLAKAGLSATKKSVRFAVIPAKEWVGEAPFLARARDGTTGPAEMKTWSNSAPPSPPRAQLALAVAALLWWAATPTAQGAGTWRVWRAGDGLAESMTRSVTVSPRGNVWVRHGEVDAISLLDGYEVRRLPSPGGAGQRVYQSRAGLIWTTDSAGLLQYAANQWRPHPIEPFQREVASSPLQALRQPPILPTSQDRVLVLLPDELLEYRGMSRSVTVVLRADETALGRFLDVTATPDAGCWISCESGLMRLAGPLRQLDPGMPRLEHLLPGELAV
ncbi:MAG: hypothetical protein KDM81_15080, partial [Verrucomicrobiae bacterium]|nr:hypothetical protein [Verrucomicrobiae bacterium]